MQNPAAYQGIQVCSISLNMSDRIRLIGVPMSLTPLLREAIGQGWGKPIQDERVYHGTHEFKLAGNPWLGGGGEAVMSRRLIAHVLMCMARNGWNLIQSGDVSKKPGDKDTMFFENATPDPDVQIFAISFNMGDRIRVIDAPSMMPYVKEAVAAQWKGRIQSEREYYDSLEIKLSGDPWWPNGAEAATSRMLLNQILANFRGVGYRLYGSVDLSAGTEGRDLESWFFRNVAIGWQ